MGSTQIGLIRDLARYPPQDPAARKDLYNAALELVYSTESAQDTAQRLYHGHVPLAMAQTGIDLNLFNSMAEREDKNWKLDELAQLTGAEPALLYRILRCLASYGMITQNATDNSYTASNITKNLAVPGTHAGIKHYSLTMTPAYNATPKFLAKTSYKNPTDSAPFNLAYNTDLPVFEWRKHNPENAKAGQAFMAAQRMGQRSIWEPNCAPVADFKLSEQDLTNDRVMFCDVGGGMGHQSLALRQHHPELKGKIVTEDLPLCIDMIPNASELTNLNIHPTPHDFMTEQPIKNAKIYYLRNVIHNWNDAPSTTILSHLSSAMASDSVLIIDDVVMPTVGATWKQASMDIAMMTMLAAMERTKEHFEELLRGAGLRLREVWCYDEEYGDSLIYAVKA